MGDVDVGEIDYVRVVESDELRPSTLPWWGSSHSVCIFPSEVLHFRPLRLSTVHEKPASLSLVLLYPACIPMADGWSML